MGLGLTGESKMVAASCKVLRRVGDCGLTEAGVLGNVSMLLWQRVEERM